MNNSDNSEFDTNTQKQSTAQKQNQNILLFSRLTPPNKMFKCLLRPGDLTAFG